MKSEHNVDLGKPMLPAETHQILSNSSLFKYLEDRDIDIILAYSKYKIFDTDEVLIKPGTICDALYLIISGEIAINANLIDKSNKTVAIIKQGEFIGETCLINNALSTLSATAITKCLCLCVTKEYFDMLYFFFPHIRYKLIKAVVEVAIKRMNNLSKKLGGLVKGKGYKTDANKSRDFSLNIFDEYHINIYEFKSNDYFKLWSEEELTILLKQAGVIDIPTRYTLIRAGELNDTYFIILRGAMQISIPLKNMRIKVAVLSPMCFFCGMSYFEEQTSILNYFSCENCLLLTITKNQMENLKKQQLQLWLKVYDLICISFIELERSLAKCFVRFNSQNR